MSSRSPLIVLGAGPKGIALWTKYVAMKDAGIDLIPMTILERKQLGSHWRGDDGFTDGSQFLVTPSEQDLGYPYALDHQDRSLALKVRGNMLRYSWMQYLLSKNSFCKWVLTERPRATHLELVDYLNWSADESKMQVEQIEVKSIAIKNGEWTLSNEKQTKVITGQGLVITGPGQPRRLEIQPITHPRISDGRTFWAKLNDFEDLSYSRIAIVGAGETAAAIAAACLDKIDDPETCSIDLICKQNAYFTRGQIQNDLRYFSDPTGWNNLTNGRRLSIIRRADRGVVSASVKEKLENSTIVEYTNADVVSIVDGGSNKLVVKLKYEEGDVDELPYDFVVVATGFDALWFIEKFDEDTKQFFFAHLSQTMSDQLKQRVAHALGVQDSEVKIPELWAARFQEKNLSKITERAIADLIAGDLSITGFLPKIHLPMLAGLSQGPGFPNLNCLGLLSDRILGTYTRP